MYSIRDFSQRFSPNKPIESKVRTIISLEEIDGNPNQRIFLGKHLARVSTIDRKAFEKAFKSKLRYGIW